MRALLVLTLIASAGGAPLARTACPMTGSAGAVGRTDTAEAAEATRPGDVDDHVDGHVHVPPAQDGHEGGHAHGGAPAGGDVGHHAPGEAGHDEGDCGLMMSCGSVVALIEKAPADRPPLPDAPASTVAPAPVAEAPLLTQDPPPPRRAV